VGIAIYTLFSVLSGPIGLSPYNQLSIERDKLKANMESLQIINQELENTKDALMYDKDTIAVYARDLGYKAKNERFIRVVGLEGTKKYRTEPGQLLFANAPEYISEDAIKICAFCIGLGTLLCFLIPDLIQYKKSRQKPGKSSYTHQRQTRKEHSRASA
jgi:hypothetical protein